MMYRSNFDLNEEPSDLLRECNTRSMHSPNWKFIPWKYKK